MSIITISNEREKLSRDTKKKHREKNVISIRQIISHKFHWAWKGKNARVKLWLLSPFSSSPSHSYSLLLTLTHSYTFPFSLPFTYTLQSNFTHFYTLFFPSVLSISSLSFHVHLISHEMTPPMRENEECQKENGEGGKREEGINSHEYQ